MSSSYDDTKATQSASIFLKLGGGKMSFMKLIKLLYLADRLAMQRFGRPITWDRYVSMPHGPVLSHTYSLIQEEPQPSDVSSCYWHAHISPPTDYEVKLNHEAAHDSLSADEVEIINQTFNEYGKLSRWQIRDLTHTLPEWKNPHGSSIPISYKEILQAVGKSEADAGALALDIAAVKYANSLF